MGQRPFKKKSLSLFILFILLFSSYTWADEKTDAKISLSYLKNGIGARAASLGNSFVAVADDVSAVYWNPAELSNMDNMNVQFIGMYGIPASNSPYLFGAVAQRIKNNQGGIGIFWHNFMIGNLNSANREHVFGISYGRSIISGLRLGVSVKYYYQLVNKSKYESLGFDFSGTIQPAGTLLKLSGSITDIGSLLLNPTFRAGISYPFVYNVFLLSMDVSKTFGEKFKPYIGMEIIPLRNIYIIEKISVRAGFDNFNYSAGLGVKIIKYTVDYSYTNDQGTSSYTHKISSIVFF